MQKNKVAATVVLYHPDANVLSNISTYYNSVDHLIAVDNSESLNPSFQKEIQRLFPGLIYIFLNKNAGIAAALNIACKIAMENKCEWLLTMDQDSSFSNNQLPQMIAEISEAVSLFRKVGIISPFHVLYDQVIVKTTKRYTVKKIVMTSGNLLSLSAYAETGSFDEKLFMDFVDYEYCLRLRKNNFKIIQDNFVLLKHSLGDFKLKKIFRQKIGVSNHNPLRRYYMTRNSLYVGFKYFRHDKIFFFHALKNIFFLDPFIILTFEKDKIAKMKSMLIGILHFIFGRYGKSKNARCILKKRVFL